MNVCGTKTVTLHKNRNPRFSPSKSSEIVYVFIFLWDHYAQYVHVCIQVQFLPWIQTFSLLMLWILQNIANVLNIRVTKSSRRNRLSTDRSVVWKHKLNDFRCHQFDTFRHTKVQFCKGLWQWLICYINIILDVGNKMTINYLRTGVGSNPETSAISNINETIGNVQYNTYINKEIRLL